MHSQQPPGVVQNWSTLQCSKQNTEQCGYDHAPVTRGVCEPSFRCLMAPRFGGKQKPGDPKLPHPHREGRLLGTHAPTVRPDPRAKCRKHLLRVPLVRVQTLRHEGLMAGERDVGGGGGCEGARLRKGRPGPGAPHGVPRETRGAGALGQGRPARHTTAARRVALGHGDAVRCGGRPPPAGHITGRPPPDRTLTTVAQQSHSGAQWIDVNRQNRDGQCQRPVSTTGAWPSIVGGQPLAAGHCPASRRLGGINSHQWGRGNGRGTGRPPHLRQANGSMQTP